MKKAIIISWIVFIMAILVFVASVLFSSTDIFIWRVFAVTMPLAGLFLLIAIILTIVHLIRSKS
jgi:hypothetical protein